MLKGISNTPKTSLFNRGIDSPGFTMSLKDVGMVTTDIMPSIQAESGPNDKAPYQMIKKKVEKYKGVRHTSILEKTIDDVTPRLPVENLFQIQAN